MLYYIEFINKFKYFVFLIIIGITLLFSSRLSQLEIENSLEQFLPKNSQSLTYYKDLDIKFGGDQVGFIILANDNIFSYEILQQVNRISNYFDSKPYVKEINSFTFSETVEGNQNEISFVPLMKDIPTDKESIKALKQKIKSDEIFGDYLLSKNGKTAAIYVKIDNLEKNKKIEIRTQFISDIEKIIKREKKDSRTEFYVIGGPVIEEVVDTTTKKDQQIFTLILFIIISICIYFFFPVMRVFIIAIITVILPFIWTYGFIGALDKKITYVCSILPTILLAYSLSDIGHFFYRYFSEKRIINNQKEALSATFKKLFIPCFLTSFTSAVAFLSFFSSDVVPVRDFGFFAGIAVLIEYLIAFSLLPLLVFILKPNLKKTGLKVVESYLQKIFESIPVFVCKNYNKIILSSILITFFFSFGILRIKIETTPGSFFDHSTEIFKSIEFADQNFGGASTIDIIIECHSECMKSPDILIKIETTQEYLKKYPELSSSISVVDYLKKMNRAFNDGSQDHYKIPQTRKEIAQLFLWQEGEGNLSSFLTENYSSSRITARIREIGSTKMRKIFKQMDKDIKDIFLNLPVEIKLTGSNEVWSEMEHYVLSSEIKSFILALLIIAFTFMILMKSFKVGLIAIIPNIVPIFISLGLMGFLDIRLNTTTAMIATIALGIVVDDTIHFFYALSKLKKIDSVRDSLRSIFMNIGGGLVFSSAILFLGFLPLCSSLFKPTQNFGILVSITIITALICDFLLTPSLAIRFNILKK